MRIVVDLMFGIRPRIEGGGVEKADGFSIFERSSGRLDPLKDFPA